MTFRLSYVIFLSAAPDVVPGLAGYDLLANVVPSLVTKLIAPWFADRMSYSFKTVLISIFLTTSFFFVGLATGMPAVQVPCSSSR